MYNSDKLYTTLTLSPTIGLWSPQFNFLLLQQWYKVETSNGTENFNNPILNFAWNNNFKLPLGISLDVDLGFDTPGDNENTKVEEWCWFANISLYKSFLKDRLSVQLKAYDLFNSYQAKSTVYSGNRLMTGKMEARRNIGITYAISSMLPRASTREQEQATARRTVCKFYISSRNECHKRYD